MFNERIMTIPCIIEPPQLLELMKHENPLIVDLCRGEVYAQMHLPGAIHVNPTELVSGKQPASGKMADLAKLENLFSRIGYSPEKQIIVYDDEGGGWAGRFIWTLDVIGHEFSAYLNGGLLSWYAAGLELTKEIPKSTLKSPVKLAMKGDVIASKEEVLNSLSNPDSIIWDARTAEEYSGQRINARRGGHIPGAINLDWLDVMDRDDNYRIRDNVADLLEHHGITPDKKIITHCQTHHRSGLTYLIAKALGYTVKAYDGSWSEWGNDLTLPIEI